jgi:hypothetical protein
VSCLSYGDSTLSAAQAQPLSDAEIGRVQQGLAAGRQWINSTAGVLGVSMGKSSDRPGEAALIVYVIENGTPAVPQTIDGVRTVVIPTSAHAVAVGAAPTADANATQSELSAKVLSQALAIKRQVVRGLMQRNPAFFGVGVGQSLDNPREAALVIYVDRKRVPFQLPQTIDGLRTRYIVMDRLHVTRSFAVPFESKRHCMPHAAGTSTVFDPARALGPSGLGLF